MHAAVGMSDIKAKCLIRSTGTYDKGN